MCLRLLPTSSACPSSCFGLRVGGWSIFAVLRWHCEHATPVVQGLRFLPQWSCEAGGHFGGPQDLPQGRVIGGVVREEGGVIGARKSGDFQRGRRVRRYGSMTPLNSPVAFRWLGTVGVATPNSEVGGQHPYFSSDGSPRTPQYTAHLRSALVAPVPFVARLLHSGSISVVQLWLWSDMPSVCTEGLPYWCSFFEHLCATGECYEPSLSIWTAWTCCYVSVAMLLLMKDISNTDFSNVHLDCNILPPAAIIIRAVMCLNMIFQCLNLVASL